MTTCGVTDMMLLQSFRFMDAYRRGLSAKAAMWAVKAQKSHRRVSEDDMRALEADEAPGEV